MEDKVNYDSLCKSRQYIRSRITRVYHTITQNLESLSEQKRIDNVKLLSNLESELNTINAQIHKFLPRDINLDELLMSEELYENRISEAFEILKPIHAVDAATNGQFTTGVGLPPLSKLKLPDISLPIFSNDKSESFEKFFYAFESILNKHNLSEYEKFVYLKGQLKKGPLALIGSLDANEQTYTCAKELLTKAFASPLSQKYETIAQLTKLKLNLDTDIYEYISEMRNIISSFNALKIDVEVILQYFIWSGMNDQMQTQFINITNNSKPSLDDINEHLFSATDRYLKVKEKNGEKFRGHKSFEAKSAPYFNNHYSNHKHTNVVQTNNLAVKVNEKPFIPCNLCVADNKVNVNHPLIKCRNYPTASDKVGKLDQLNYCSKCSFSNHNKTKCRFKFSSKCRNCSGTHLSYLCLTSDSVISNIATVRFNSALKKDDIILPTFSVNVCSSGRVKKCRVLQDTGSQRNFILDSVVRSMNLEVVRNNVNILIHGVNSDKNITTDIVKVPITVNGKHFNYEAIVVPRIDVTMEVPDLKLITENFESKGFLLADGLLPSSDSRISGFDMVMGPDCIQLLMPRAIEFGHESSPSVYFESRLGVLLAGSPQAILTNLKFLPEIKSNRLNRLSSEVNANIAFEETEINSCITKEILNEDGEINDKNLELATAEALEECTTRLMNYDNCESFENYNEIDTDIVQFVITNTTRNSDGRLVMPLPWNPRCKDNLAQNFNLSKKVLISNKRKLEKDDKLALYDEVFQEQERLGIVERINDVQKYVSDHPNCSFLPHMGVFKLNRETTKVRVVYLSNLCEKTLNRPDAVSHNCALLPGPCLNSKLITSLLLSRFDKHILIFDIAKAFLGIELMKEDQNKLLCLWFRSVRDGDFSFIAYKNLRLSFGLRPSPTLLMLGLYKMLILDTENDNSETIELKKMIYNNMYMDNGVVSANDSQTLEHYYKHLPLIFGDYQFALQQFATNDSRLQSIIDLSNENPSDTTVKFFGVQWDKDLDSLGPFPLKLDENANTKRKVLSSLNGVYDPFNLYAPILNRAKLFLQRLQLEKSLNWDKKLTVDFQNEWKRICKQANNTGKLSVPRFVGSRDGKYSLVAFCDASSAIYGAVLYLLENSSGKVSFILAKNKVLNASLKNKSIPSLECQGAAYAAELIITTFNDLTDDKLLLPINIDKLCVYTDSMVVLSWIRSYFVNYDKMQKKSVFVMNRLKQIGNLCQKAPITFRYIEGRENPADCVTRPLSYFKLKQTTYLSGPSFLRKLDQQPDLEVTVPCEAKDENQPTTVMLSSTTEKTREEKENISAHLFKLDNYSSFAKCTRIYVNVYRFINKLKEKCCERKGIPTNRNENYREGLNALIRRDQQIFFPDVFNFFQQRNLPLKKIPNLVKQMNLFLDENSLIRVKGKFSGGKHQILLNSNSYLARLIVLDLHNRCSHAGLFTILRELKKKFWLMKGFCTVKKILRQCITCRKLNERPIKLNQGLYREFRADPPRTPFASVFMDYIGPINIKVANKVQKIWILIVTCLWSRAVSLELVYSADTGEFLRAVQMHIYRFGLFQTCISDLGSQLTAGANIITECIEQEKQFFEENSIKRTTFHHYCKGNSSLGALVESLVKQTKHLLIKSIGKVVLDHKEFQLVLCKTMSLLNRRPVAFKDALRDSVQQGDAPEPITPEMLVYGRELFSMDVIPSICPVPNDSDFEPGKPVTGDSYDRVRKVVRRLSDVYHREFLSQLLHQAIDQPQRYKPVRHKLLEPGDIVLLIEPNLKRNNYPLGIIRTVEKNCIGEVTAATVFKGRTRKVVYVHATTIILLLRPQSVCAEESTEVELSITDDSQAVRPQRAAAASAKREMRKMYEAGEE